MFVALILTISIGSYFWVDSRYPALLKKLHSGKAVRLSGTLSFDALMPVAPAMPLTTRIGHTIVNWLWTNRIGMTFGICFGAAMLTLLPMLPRIRFNSAAANTLLGTVTGLPLGVCANCVAPIGRSLFNAGASPSTVLAAMISSPMLNVVVLAMVFTLFRLASLWCGWLSRWLYSHWCLCSPGKPVLPRKYLPCSRLLVDGCGQRPEH